MISKASASHLRIAPRKVRYVIDKVRKKTVDQAQAILNGSPRAAAEIIRKLLNQAVDAAERNSQILARDLHISKITADGGPTMKRFRAASMGRASVIRKRTSHIHLELDRKTSQAVPALPKTKIPAEKKVVTSFAKVGTKDKKLKLTGATK